MTYLYAQTMPGLSLARTIHKRYTEELEERVPGLGVCWVWKGAKEGEYGDLKIGGKTFKAHRVSYWVFVGNISGPDVLVCHRCDNPRCVRPHHLTLGNHAFNMRDAKLKGRVTGKPFEKGEAAPDAKLTWEQVREIRRRYRERERTQVQLAKIYGVSRSAITQILRNKTWKENDDG
jgi:hypothetical protein